MLKQLNDHRIEAKITRVPVRGALAALSSFILLLIHIKWREAEIPEPLRHGSYP
jgi:hypothetical protein